MRQTFTVLNPARAKALPCEGTLALETRRKHCFLMHSMAVGQHTAECIVTLHRSMGCLLLGVQEPVIYIKDMLHLLAGASSDGIQGYC